MPQCKKNRCSMLLSGRFSIPDVAVLSSCILPYRTGPCGYTYTIEDVKLLESHGLMIDERLGIVRDIGDPASARVRGVYYDFVRHCVTVVAFDV